MINSSGTPQMTSSSLVEWSLAITPREEQREENDGNDDQQHQVDGDHYQMSLLRRDITGRIQHHRIAAGEPQQGEKHQSAANF
jgi:hypothetical protein